MFDFIDFKVTRTITMPTPWYRDWFPFLFKPQLPLYLYDVEFKTRMIEHLKPSHVILVDAGYQLFVNRISNGIVYAQTPIFIPDTDLKPAKGVIISIAYEEATVKNYVSNSSFLNNL